MALGEEDLRFKLTVDPDTAKMQEAIKDIGKDLDKQAAQAKAAWTDLGKAGASQLESIRANQKLSEGFLPTLQPAYEGVINLRVEAMQKITREMGEQKALLERINVEMNPQTLKERVTLERELKTARQEYLDAHKAETLRQGGEQEDQPNKIQQILGAAAGGAGAVALEAGLGQVGVLAGAAAGGILLLTDGLKGMINTIASYVQVASPSTFYRFQYTLRDLEGVIGGRLAPVLDAITVAIRAFADALDGALPKASEIKGAIDGIRTIFNVFTAGIDRTHKALEWALRGASIFGVLPGGAGSSFGAAARPARLSGIEEYEKEFQQSALSASSLQQSVPQQQLDVLKQIRDLIGGGKPATGFVGPGTTDSTADPFGIRRAIFGF